MLLDHGQAADQRICQWFLTHDPVYAHELHHVWLWDDWPGRWGADAGIDLVAEDRQGHLWAIQAKAYDPATRITKRDASPMRCAGSLRCPAQCELRKPSRACYVALHALHALHALERSSAGSSGQTIETSLMTRPGDYPYPNPGACDRPSAPRRGRRRPMTSTIVLNLAAEADPESFSYLLGRIIGALISRSPVWSASSSGSCECPAQENKPRRTRAIHPHRAGQRRGLSGSPTKGTTRASRPTRTLLGKRRRVIHSKWRADTPRFRQSGRSRERR